MTVQRGSCVGAELSAHARKPVRCDHEKSSQGCQGCQDSQECCKRFGPIEAIMVEVMIAQFSSLSINTKPGPILMENPLPPATIWGHTWCLSRTPVRH